MCKTLAVIAALLLCDLAQAQSSPGFLLGQLSTALQRDGHFAAKQDLLTVPSYLIPANANFTTASGKTHLTLASSAPSIMIGSNIMGTTYPESYGASHSTASLSGCSISSSSNQLSCSSPSDFSVGEGVRVPGAGPVSPLSSTVAAPTLTVNGTTGSTTYEYAWCRADPWGGISGCNTATVTNGNATLNIQNSIEVASAYQGVNAELGLIYRKVGSGSWQFLTADTVSPFIDIGWTPPCSGTADNCGWPSIPAPQNQDLFSYVTAVNDGTNTFTLHDNASATLSGTAAIYHDDTLAVQSALSNCGAGIVRFGPYTYNVDLPSVWNFITQQFYHTFTASTPNYPSLYGQGKLQIYSGCTVAGSGKGVTNITSVRMTNPNGQDYTFGMNTGQHYGPWFWPNTPTNCAISDTIVGQSTVTTTIPSCAANFNPGDYVMAGGGAPMAGSYYSFELTRVISANSSTGLIRLEDPFEKANPFGTPGQTPIIYLITPETVHDINIHDMTINNLSGWLMNSSATYKTNVYNISCPQLGNTLGFFAEGARFFACNNCDLTGAAEISGDEDFIFTDGTWYSHNGIVGTSDGSSNIVFDREVLTLTDLSCGAATNGQSCSLSTGFAGILAQNMAATRFQVLNSLINCNYTFNNSIELNGGAGCLSESTGKLPGASAVPYGLTWSNNIINSNGRYVIAEQYAGSDFHVDNNLINLTNGAEHQTFPVQITSGTFNGNVVNVTSATHSSGAMDYIVTINPLTAVPVPISVSGNYINVAAGGPLYTGIGISDPGSTYGSPILLHGNRITNTRAAITVVSPVNTPNVKLGSNSIPMPQFLVEP